ncbi:MAG TPA: response regulator transcription factor [Actinomycetota bacterium]|nr:response regulator transcription factor [Actinomycetota bacterium]
MPSNDHKRIKVLIVDDHRTFGEALQLALGREKDLRVVDVVTDAPSVIEAVRLHDPDVILMDMARPDAQGIETTRRIKDADPDAHVLILSGHEDEYLLARVVQAGATGLLRRSEGLTLVASSVRRVHRGEPLHDREEIEGALRRLRHRRDREASTEQRLARLTPREVEILQRMASGGPSDRMAKDLGMSPHTLRTHTQNIITKLGVHSRLEALVLAIRHGTVTMLDVTDDREDWPSRGEP